jgi:uncharacterized repeat protein (TIGR01451 family)
MHKFDLYRRCGLAAAICIAATAWGQARLNPLVIRAIAEIEQPSKLLPADRVVSGDQVLYTLEVRNTAATTVAIPLIVYPIPTHMVYVADSAVGPGGEVSFSIDGGRSFARPENLTRPAAQGQLRAAVAADYTHIRWQLKNALKSNSVAFVRFRAVVK